MKTDRENEQHPRKKRLVNVLCNRVGKMGVYWFADVKAGKCSLKRR